ncbi:hypothetical protein AW27_014820 [Streptomyces sp. PCS3-D2]|uniref:hypothetical protein n=1 Tax=Streptomyces sp. PCS3-D2 TaxID=1460244 RepID=UPI00044BA3B3|nr:hypothetical protein [Streptomyces sp. PCS3-D2]WKV72686.1 hypothetical protein AW27_014820 [Streptomyces sp. PCS3-D2]
MRQTRTLAAAAALVALTALTGCGDGEAQQTGFGGKSLPKAKDVASMVRFINQHTVCKDLETEATAGGFAKSATKKLPNGAEGGVKERAFCESDQGDPMVLLVISDMKKFEQGLKAKKEAGEQGRALVGADFAVVPEDGETVTALTSAGMLIVSCDERLNSKIPSGYSKREASAKGCIRTDYIPR